MPVNPLAQDALAEQAILASIFNDPASLEAVADLLDSSDFYEPKNEILYATIVKLQQTGKAFDPVSLASYLKNEGTLNEAGGIQYLSEIVNPQNIVAYGSDPIGHAATVKANARRRRLSIAAERILEAATLGSGLTAEDATVVAETEIFEITNSESANLEILSIANLYPDAIENIKAAKDRPEGVMAGIPTGFPDLDKKTNGFKPGQLVLLAARPGVGKSTLAVDFCRSAAFLAGRTVLFFSLEMSSEELTERIISSEARVELQNLRAGNVTQEEWMNIHEIEEKLNHGTFLVDATPNVNLSRVRSMALRQKMKTEGLDMIVIDYLQLMEVGAGTSKNASRQEQVSALSRGLKLLAKEMQVPIVVLSQLNRNSESRTDQVPKVSDLRESGSLEQDADLVLLIHRPEVGDENNRPGEVDLIIGKQRSGPTGKIPLTSMLAYSKFVPGQGMIEREAEMLPEDGAYTATDDETPW